MKVVALIPVRSGSVRVKNKNLKPFAGSNLLKLKIEQLLKIKNIDEIVINSNSDEMLEIAKEYPVTLVKREEKFASNEVSMSEVYKNMAENIKGDIIVYTNCTSPLIKAKTIEKMIDLYKGMDKKEYDSINSCHDIKEFLWLHGKAINYDTENQPRSQDLPRIVALNFAVSIISKEDMIRHKNLIGKKPFLYTIDEIESTDIDTPLDFEIAEYLYKKEQEHNE
jgi:CMP-N-acetylneuraminic acid synthetase